MKESLGRNFYDEEGESDNEYEPDEDYIHPLHVLYDDPDEERYVTQGWCFILLIFLL